MFVNMARVSPDVLVSEFGRLRIKEPPSVAICIMTGIITDCAIVSDGFAGGPENGKTVHKVSIAPFRQDFRRDSTMWGKTLFFDNLSCAISTEGVTFTTKPRTISVPIFPSSPGMSCLVLYFMLLRFLIFCDQEGPLKLPREWDPAPRRSCSVQHLPAAATIISPLALLSSEVSILSFLFFSLACTYSFCSSDL